MLYVFPDYYPEFQCIAGACEDTCCAGWQIMVDDRSLRKYRSEKGPYRKKLQHMIDWKKKSFRQGKEKRCAFLKEDNLCEMYCQLGAESLCRTCRLYPRHVEEFENVREISLSISCPEAARLLLEREKPLHFLEFWKEREETYESFDELFYSQLTECRDWMIRILQKRELSLKLRLGLVSGLANDMQKAFCEGRLFDCQELFERVEDPDSFAKLVKITERKLERTRTENYEWIKGMFAELSQFECLKEAWPLWLEETEHWLYQDGQENYEQLEREFLTWLSRSERDWQIPFEQLSIYFLFTYFCGAVYDGEILASAQLGIVHVWILREMLMAVWLRNGKEVNLEDLKELTVRYSRELEHSDINQKRMEKVMVRRRLPWLKRKEIK